MQEAFCLLEVYCRSGKIESRGEVGLLETISGNTLGIILVFFLCISKAIHLLPANTQISEIRIFLEKVLEENAQKKRFSQVLKNLLHAEFLRVCIQQFLFHAYEGGEI